MTDGEKAVQRGAPQIHDNAPGNVAFNWNIGDKAKTDAAIKGAHKVVKQRLINHRLIPNADRAAVRRWPQYNSAMGELTCWVTSQNPARTPACSWRRSCSGCLSTSVRVISGTSAAGSDRRSSSTRRRSRSPGRRSSSDVR